MCHICHRRRLAKPLPIERCFKMMKIRIRRNRPVQITVAPMRPPQSDRILQPLREVGTMEKTQPWSTEDIQAALREANLRGIAPESLYATAQKVKLVS